MIASLRRRLTRLLTEPIDELGSFARFLRSQVELWRFCVGQLRRNNALAMSSALSFRTIFALVPTLILAFLLLKSFGVVEDGKQLLRRFLVESGLARISYVDKSQPPASQEPTQTKENTVTIAEKIEAIVAHAEKQLTIGRLGPVGAALMIWTALTLLTTMERCLNRIFQAPGGRPIVRRILLYWSALTLGPVLLVAVTYAGRKGAEASHDIPVLSWLVGPIGWAAPVAAGILLMAALYSLMPNTRVPFVHALAGAIAAVPLWLVARWAFALYVQSVGRQSLYGAIVLIPLFLLWLNFSWYIFLFGAQLSFAVGHASRLQGAAGSPLLTSWHLLGAVAAVSLGQSTRDKPAALAQIAKDLSLSEEFTEALLAQLISRGVICSVAADETPTYVMVKRAERLRVANLLQLGGARGSAGTTQGWNRSVARIVERAHQQAMKAVHRLTLADIMEPENPKDKVERKS